MIADFGMSSVLLKEDHQIKQPTISERFWSKYEKFSTAVFGKKADFDTNGLIIELFQEMQRVS